MESNKNLVFLGMMGSGKTTLGKIVSKKLNKEFIDVDQTIEHQEGMVISEIFKILSVNSILRLVSNS